MNKLRYGVHNPSFQFGYLLGSWCAAYKAARVFWREAPRHPSHEALLVVWKVSKYAFDAESVKLGAFVGFDDGEEMAWESLSRGLYAYEAVAARMGVDPRA